MTTLISIEQPYGVFASSLPAVVIPDDTQRWQEEVVSGVAWSLESVTAATWGLESLAAATWTNEDTDA